MICKGPLYALLVQRVRAEHLSLIVRARAPENKAILEALEDYELACAKEKDGTMRLDEKAEWSRIRKEVAAELERLISRQSKSGGNT